MGREADWEREIIEPVLQFDQRRISARLGVTVAVAVAVPVALAVYADYTAAGVIAALGAFNLFIGVGGSPAPGRWNVGVLALALNGLGLAAGTLVAAIGITELLWVAIGLTALLSVRLLPTGRWTAISAAALFCIGVGLPAASAPAVIDRLALAVAGGAWAMAVSALADGAFTVSWGTRSASAGSALALDTRPLRPTLVAAAVTGVTAAIALGLANLLSLPRDYWAMLTVVVVFQTGLWAALSTTTVRVVGTITGALIGGAIATLPLGPEGLTLVAGGLAGGTLAVRPASPSVYVILLTPFVIVLLSITFPSGWSLAQDRVLETILGSAASLTATGLLRAAGMIHRKRVRALGFPS